MIIRTNMIEKESSHNPENRKTVEEAVREYANTGDVESAVAFLKTNKGEVTEFCLQLRDRYGEKDTTTAILLIARILEKLL